MSLSSKIKMNFRERKIKDLNLEFCGATVSGSKAEIKPLNSLAEPDRGWRNIASSDIDGVGNTLLQGNRSFKVD